VYFEQNSVIKGIIKDVVPPDTAVIKFNEERKFKQTVYK
jgi:hypothetical protein